MTLKTTILGAGGGIGNELVKILAPRGVPLRLVSRNPKPVSGVEMVGADLTDRAQTIEAVAGSSVVHLLVGLKYDVAVWQELWPRIMANTIEACKQAAARLIFFDNVYMYGRVNGRMTEDTPYAPCSKKGEIRAKIATTLMDEVKAGNLQAMIVRAADFYGPNTKNSGPNLLIFDPLANGAKATCLVSDSMPHSLTFTPDAAQGVAMLAERNDAWNQVWHLPTRQDPPTSQELVHLAATELGVEPRYRVLHRPVLRAAGLFNPVMGELFEMLYQSDSPYLFDSTKFALTFGFSGTAYADGVRMVAKTYAPVRRTR